MSNPAGQSREERSSSSSHRVICCVYEITGSLGLRITGLSVPSQVQLGSDVFLQCHFDLEGSNLYALKWYKGQHGIYIFLVTIFYRPKFEPRYFVGLFCSGALDLIILSCIISLLKREMCWIGLERKRNLLCVHHE